MRSGPRCSNCLCDLVCERGVIEAAEMADVEVVFTPWPYDAVARGVALLDEKVPGWRVLVGPSVLNLVELWRLAGSPNDWFLYGFSTRWRDSYVALANAWREAIAGGAE